MNNDISEADTLGLIRSIFRYGSRYRTAKTEPHEVIKDYTGKIVLITLREDHSDRTLNNRRSQRGYFAFNMTLLEEAEAALNEGKLTKAYVVIIVTCGGEDRHWDEVYRFAEVSQVLFNIRKCPSHWIDEDFLPIPEMRTITDEEPF